MLRSQTYQTPLGGLSPDRCRDLAPQGVANSLWSLAALRPKGPGGSQRDQGSGEPGAQRKLMQTVCMYVYISIHTCSMYIYIKYMYFTMCMCMYICIYIYIHLLAGLRRSAARSHVRASSYACTHPVFPCLNCVRLC